MQVLVVGATEREVAAAGHALVCGIGPVEAAARTARALASRRPEALLHVGIAGARTLEPGTVVIGSEAVYCDLAAAVPLVERVEPDGDLVARVRAALPEAAVLPIGTSARVGGAPETLELEAMEGFAVLRAAELAGVAAVEVRVVSNAVAEPDRARWRIEHALARLDDVVASALSALAGVPSP